MINLPTVLIASSVFLILLFLTLLFDLAPVAYFLYLIFAVVILQVFFRFSPQTLGKVSGVLIFGLIIYPLVGYYIAIAFCYVVLLVIFQRFRYDRYSFLLTVFFLLMSAFSLIYERWSKTQPFGLVAKESGAQSLAVLAYMFLIIGAVQKSVELIRPKSTIHPLT